MKALLIALFVFSMDFANGQTSVRGKVVDEQMAPIPGANVFLDGTYDGTTSEADGTFSFITGEEGEQILVIKFIGYRAFRRTLDLADASGELTIVLKEEVNELKAVTISAGAFTADDQSRRTIFRPVDIATTAGATADIAGALNTLPGTQKVGESGRLFVRGGDGTETRTFIDGLLVMDAYAPSAPNTPSRGRFLPFMFKGTSFSTGGYSAEFGQALSSALVLDSKDESEVTRTDIGILSVGGDVAHTQAWKSGSASAKVQYTNIRPYFGLINQEVDWVTPPASIEGVAALRQKVGKNGIVKFYGNATDSDFSLYQHDIDNPDKTTFYKLRNRYRYGNASYREALNDRWVLRGGFSGSVIENTTTVEKVKSVSSTLGLHGKAVVEGSVTDNVELKAGVEVYHNASDVAAAMSQIKETLPALFAEADIYASNRFVTRVGGRFEYNSINEHSNVDPRLSLAYRLPNAAQVSFAYGIFRQMPRIEFLQKSSFLKAERSQHFILNYQQIKNDRTFRVEAYFKKYDDLIKLSPSSISNDGTGFAKGIEVFWRDNQSVRRLDYWVSYSLLDTERDYLDFPYSATPSFASKHNFSFVAKYFFQSLKSQVGATYSFASGRPFDNPNEKTFNASRTPAYQDLSVNLSYLPRPNLILYLSCTNLPGYDNIFGYEFSDEMNERGTYNGRAIRQPAPRFIFLGVFITLSKEKSLSQLPVL